jgi:radical SAM superfamily enzyme YgiQ (UPF0313 family)
MRILLVQPPIEDYYDTSIRTYPLGLLYLARAIRDVADVSILDARTTRKPVRLEKHPFPELDEFYREDVYTPFSFFSRYSRFGMSANELHSELESANADMVCVAALCSAYEQQALEVARIAKEVDPNVITVMGGVHATLFPARLLSHPDVDYCVRGEGETPLFNLVSALSKNEGDIKTIGGLCSRLPSGLRISGVHSETNIDALPERRLLNADRYRINKKRYTFFLTSRGCPFRCGFCGKPPVPYRKRTLSSIEEELDDCQDIGIEAIDFEDDMLNLDKRTFAGILQLLVGRGLTLSAMNGIYPGNMDISTLRLMYESGFRRLNFSLVDIAETVISAHNRNPHSDFLGLLPFLEESGFLTEVHFIIGLPDQSPENLVDTLLFLMERRVLLGPSIFYHAPGSPIYEARFQDTNSIDPGQMRSSVMLPVNPLFGRPITYTFVKLVRFLNEIKRLADRNGGPSRLSDLLNPRSGWIDDERGQKIIEQLLRKKEFLRWDKKQNQMGQEPQDQALVRFFFQRAKGMKIKGYRTNAEILFDM